MQYKSTLGVRIFATVFIALLCGNAMAEYCTNQRNLALVNGRIHSMDEQNQVLSSVFIKDGLFVALSDDDYAEQECTDVIDLQGRTVIPGLIDNHVHFIRIQNRPGYDTREIESAFSVREVLEVISAKADLVPEGELISAIGGFRQWQWVEGRFPTLEELDRVAPNHPVYLSEHGFGPGQTNSAARELLLGLGVDIATDGSVAEREATALAYEVLATNITDEHRRRQLQDLISWANKVGLTTAMDMSGTVPGVGFLDQRIGYEPIVSLERNNQLNLRTRLYLPALDEDSQLRQLQGRLDNTFHNFGTDMLKIVGVGEWSVGRSLFNEQPLGDAAIDAQWRMAERGWTYHQHLHSPAEINAHLEVWESIDSTYDLSELRWTPGHMSGATPELIERVIDLGLGIGAHGQPYSQRGNGGPPWRTIVESDLIAKAAGSDGARISPFNPWSIIYYMVTGKNSAGESVNTDQNISRMDAVKLYSSADQGWFTKEDDKLGGIALGRYADLVVLSKNVFDEEEVSDQDLRKMTSSLTIVGGRVVYSDGSLD
jgi:predicted amidohydrolase YtcJ